MTRIAIVGTGLIGRAWAVSFAAHGFQVALHDPVEGVAVAALGNAAGDLERLAAHGLVEDPAPILARMRVATDLGDALGGVALVQESGPEKLDVKRALFTEMDRLAPADAVLASSTSFILASAFTEGLEGSGRMLVAHPVNPPHVVPIVELAPAPWTDPAIVAKAKSLYEQAGQVAIVLRKEKPGFVLNRLQAVLLAEAFRLVGEGVASAEDVDKTIRDGLGLRWAFMGPFETIELNAPGGIPDYCARYAASLDRMCGPAGSGGAFDPRTVDAVMAEWRGTPDPDRIARLSRWRDERIAALVAHKRGALPKPA